MKVKFKPSKEAEAFAKKFGAFRLRDMADEVSEIVARDALKWMLEYIRDADYPLRKSFRRGKGSGLKHRNFKVIGLRGGNLDDSGAYIRSLRAFRFGQGMWGIVAKAPLTDWLEFGTRKMDPRPHFAPTWEYARGRAPTVFSERMRRALS